MLQCTCCGAYCRQPGYFWQNRGEYFGFPSWEELGGCPICGGGLELLEEEDYLWEVDAND